MVCFGKVERLERGKENSTIKFNSSKNLKIEPKINTEHIIMNLLIQSSGHIVMCLIHYSLYFKIFHTKKITKFYFSIYSIKNNILLETK